MARSWRADTPWRRLPWLLPAAIALSLLGIAAFLLLLAGRPQAPRQPVAIEMQLVELPAPPSVVQQPEQLSPPPPPPPEPPPPPVQEPVLVPPEPPVQPPPPPPPQPPPPQRPPPRPAVPRPAPPRPAAPVQPPPPAAITAPPPAAPAPPSLLPGGGNSAARAIYQPRPEIPDALRRRALDLVAVARFEIAASGAAQVELIDATPDPALNRALLETLKTWRFFPALVAGKPAASVLEIRIPLSVR